MSFKRLYLLIATLVGLVGTAISLGVIVFSLLNRVIISDDDYLSTHYWEIANCAQAMDYKADGEPIERSPEEIATCEEEARERVLGQRHMNFKESLVGGLSWGLVALLLLLSHGVPFLRSRDS